MISINDIYKNIVLDLYMSGKIVAARSMRAKEFQAHEVRIDPQDNIITLPGFETNLEYAMTELAWYYSGDPSINYSPLIKRVWEKYSDDGMHVNSNYGERIFGKHPLLDIDQWQWVKDKIIADPDTRQAVININSYFDKYQETKDFPCTMCMQFMQRDNKLDMIVYMRSNDIYYGFRNDIYCFAEMQKRMARELCIDSGIYTHIAGSMHLYEKDWPKVERLTLDVVRRTNDK